MGLTTTFTCIHHIKGYHSLKLTEFGHLFDTQTLSTRRRCRFWICSGPELLVQLKAGVTCVIRDVVGSHLYETVDIFTMINSLLKVYG